MATYEGTPSVVELNPQIPYSISSTTNATPIVATTTTTHNLQPGDYFYIEGATDPNANGKFMAGAVTATTVVLLTAPGGANSVGTLAGGAAGTLAPLGFGLPYTIPTDAVDDMDAGSINVSLEALGDRTNYLQYGKADGRENKQARIASILLDWSIASSWVIGELTGNVTFTSAFPLPGQTYQVYVIQDGTGGRTVTWPGDFAFGTLSATAGAGVGQATIWLFRYVLPLGATSGNMLCIAMNIF
jgi:hypothetical protein